MRPLVVPVSGGEWPLPSQYVGVELEVENCSPSQQQRLLDTSHYWEIKEDHSLRDGVEFVLAQPLMGEQLSESLVQFSNSVTRYSVGPRTSTHVHLNMRQDTDTLESLRNLCLLYFMYEDAFFALSDRSRKWCSYCHPFEESPPEPLLAVLRGHNIDAVSASLSDSYQNSNRYYGLNLYALQRYGTIEFRHMPGTRDIDKLRVWIRLLMELKKAATALADEEVNLFEVFNSPDSMAAIETMMPEFGAALRRLVSDKEAFRKLGVTSMYATAISERVVADYGVPNAENNVFLSKYLAGLAASQPRPEARAPRTTPPPEHMELDELLNNTPSQIQRMREYVQQSAETPRVSRSTTNRVRTGALPAVESWQPVYGDNPSHTTEGDR
jgi:hypothetical protein